MGALPAERLGATPAEAAGRTAEQREEIRARHVRVPDRDAWTRVAVGARAAGRADAVARGAPGAGAGTAVPAAHRRGRGAPVPWPAPRVSGRGP
ncbi:hypothetical protein Shyhy01_70550 [Streptomyces hygroscopicus subsp. hygroscopicus]|nr:hypothetical protein Shyhy01_70550 [Streptomyces hygroscopicus subsp. hygroscopicus]